MEFELTQLLFKDAQMSKGNVDHLMQILSRSAPNGTAPFHNYKDLLARIDAIEVGDVTWESFVCKYEGDISDESPSWMSQGYEVHYRDPLDVIKNILSNTDFKNRMDYAPYLEYDAKGERQFHDFMSANWANDQAVLFMFYTDYWTHALKVASLYRQK